MITYRSTQALLSFNLILYCRKTHIKLLKIGEQSFRVFNCLVLAKNMLPKISLKWPA